MKNKVKISHKAKILFFAYAIAIVTAVPVIGYLMEWW